MSQLVTKVEVLEDGANLEFNVYGSPAILVNDRGKFRAFINVCPHRGGPMQFEKENNTLRCKWHDNIWSLTGDHLDGPAEKGTCLIPVELTIKDGYVYSVG